MKVILEIPDDNPHLLDDLFGDAIVYTIRNQVAATGKSETAHEYRQMVAYYAGKIDAYEALKATVQIVHEDEK